MKIITLFFSARIRSIESDTSAQSSTAVVIFECVESFIRELRYALALLHIPLLQISRLELHFSIFFLVSPSQLVRHKSQVVVHASQLRAHADCVHSTQL